MNSETVVGTGLRITVPKDELVTANEIIGAANDLGPGFGLPPTSGDNSAAAPR